MLRVLHFSVTFETISAKMCDCVFRIVKYARYTVYPRVGGGCRLARYGQCSIPGGMRDRWRVDN